MWRLNETQIGKPSQLITIYHKLLRLNSLSARQFYINIDLRQGLQTKTRASRHNEQDQTSPEVA
ncbi:hypothetical protein EMIT0P43_30117 [Pseudomonas jessenii]